MKYDFSVRAGNSGTVKNELGLEAVVKSGAPAVPVDLTGQEVVFVVRATPDRPPVLRKTSEDGGVVVNAIEGRVLVPLSAAETRAMMAGAPNGADRLLIYELERRGPDLQRAILYGRLTVLRGANDD